MDIQKRQPPGGGKRGVSDYHPLIGRHASPSRSPSLGAVILWVVIGVTALVAFERWRKAPTPAASSPNLTATEAPLADPPATMPATTVAYAPLEGASPAPVPGTVSAPSSRQAPVEEEPAKPDTTVRATLQKDQAGNYIGTGAINQKSVRLLVDTGSSMVVIPEPLANRIGLKKGKAMPFRTAGGTVVHYATELDTLSIGAIQINHVPAAINPQMQEDFALLGMSALALLRFSQEGNDLVLSYDPGVSDKPATDNPEPVRFRRSVKECMGDSKIVDQKTLDCLNGD